MDRKKKFCIIAMIAAILGFAAIFCVVFTGKTAPFDDAVRGFFYAMRNPVLNQCVKVLTRLGNTETIVILCILLLAFKKTRKTYGIVVSAGALIVSGVNRLIKYMVCRARPDEAIRLIEETGYSFPSGHSITSMFVYGLLIYLVRENVKNRRTANILTVVLAIPMILIGPSRIYLGVHYPTDVLAGWCLGLTAICAAILIVSKIKTVQRPDPDQRKHSLP